MNENDHEQLELDFRDSRNSHFDFLYLLVPAICYILIGLMLASCTITGKGDGTVTIPNPMSKSDTSSEGQP